MSRSSWFRLDSFFSRLVVSPAVSSPLLTPLAMRSCWFSLRSWISPVTGAEGVVLWATTGSASMASAALRNVDFIMLFIGTLPGDVIFLVTASGRTLWPHEKETQRFKKCCGIFICFVSIHLNRDAATTLANRAVLRCTADHSMAEEVRK